MPVRRGGLQISKDKNALQLNDCRSAEVHIDFAGRDQPSDVHVCNIFDLLQEIAQPDSRLRLHSRLDSLVYESGHAPAVEPEIVLQALQVSLQDPIDLFRASHSMVQARRQGIFLTRRTASLAFTVTAEAVRALDGQLLKVLRGFAFLPRLSRLAPGRPAESTVAGRSTPEQRRRTPVGKRTATPRGGFRTGWSRPSSGRDIVPRRSCAHHPRVAQGCELALR